MSSISFDSSFSSADEDEKSFARKREPIVVVEELVALDADGRLLVARHLADSRHQATALKFRGIAHGDRRLRKVERTRTREQVAGGPVHIQQPRALHREVAVERHRADALARDIKRVHHGHRTRDRTDAAQLAHCRLAALRREGSACR